MSVPMEKLESDTSQSSKSQESVLLDLVCVSLTVFPGGTCLGKTVGKTLASGQ